MMWRNVRVPAAAMAATGLTLASVFAQMLVEQTEPDLYEHLEVIGDIVCTPERDIHLEMGVGGEIECEYRPGGLPQTIKIYSGDIRQLRGGLFYNPGDYVCWTVLFLRHVGGLHDQPETITGDFQPATPQERQKFALKESALIGGPQNVLALEPQCADRLGPGDREGAENIGAWVERVAFREL